MCKCFTVAKSQCSLTYLPIFAFIAVHVLIYHLFREKFSWHFKFCYTTFLSKLIEYSLHWNFPTLRYIISFLILIEWLTKIVYWALKIGKGLQHAHSFVDGYFQDYNIIIKHEYNKCSAYLHLLSFLAEPYLYEHRNITQNTSLITSYVYMKFKSYRD